ncbi:thioesterase domain-containing protein [Ochrobactrum sp. RH2CCR150]|nr:thioesterase domain-containing protein [Ochrobactrum sp. RH2CCR150]
MTNKSGNSAKYFISRRSLLASGLASSLLMAAMPVAALAKSAKTAVPSPNTNDKQGNGAQAGRPDVYLLRGFANIFSTGIDEIGADLQAAGVDAHVEGNAAWRLVANRIIADRQKYGPQPVILVGHSLGANAIISIAEVLEKRGIRVDYMASFAATAPDPLPGNIRRVVNFYFSQHGWGLPLVPGPRFKGKLDNRDFAGMKEVGHFNIEKQRPLQAEVVRDILRILK